MPPKESDSLLGGSPSYNNNNRNKKGAASPLFLSRQSSSMPLDEEGEAAGVCGFLLSRQHRRRILLVASAVALFLAVAGALAVYHFSPTAAAATSAEQRIRSGPYELSQAQVGHHFTDYYDFYEGADSLGSAGYNNYTDQQRARDRNLINVTDDPVTGTQFLYLNSRPTALGPRESVRLEGKRRFDAGLFVIDLDHMPAGCGQWPAFWLTDDDDGVWPQHGEIDVVEGVNYQSTAKTALHTSDQCSMYAHVPDYSFTGHWDRATGLPDTYTGVMDLETSVPADNCWVMAPHQWANQGCVAVDKRNDTLGPGLNRAGGGVYALEWDPIQKHAIRSWVFPKSHGVPANLQESIDAAASSSSSSDHHNADVTPDPDQWGLPYAVFAIGEGTGCSADHFTNMRLVLNTAFCGTVAGNRFFRDCPAQAQRFNVSNDPVLSCNAWIRSQPDELAEAYWKIRGVYVYERAWETNTTAGVDETSG